MGRFTGRIIGLFSIAISVLLLTGCAGKSDATQAPVPVDLLPESWEAAGDAIVFDSDSLYDLVNGQAESFFAYGFEQVTVQDYENTENARLSVEIWELAASADAYGLFTVSIAGEPIDIGNAGDTDPGRRLSFWQDRYYVQVRARQELSEGDIRGFAEATAAGLPVGGGRPALVERLPTASQVERSTRFFHAEISFQDDLWLGGKNLLRLSPKTDGCLAKYKIDGRSGLLLLIEYPDEDSADEGLAALQDSSVEPLLSAATQGRLLGAVFGDIAPGAADELLGAALEE